MACISHLWLRQQYTTITVSTGGRKTLSTQSLILGGYNKQNAKSGKGGGNQTKVVRYIVQLKTFGPASSFCGGGVEGNPRPLPHREVPPLDYKKWKSSVFLCPCARRSRRPNVPGVLGER